MVVANNALIYRSLPHATKGKERNPTAEPELIDIGLSCNAVESFVESLTRHVAV